MKKSSSSNFRTWELWPLLEIKTITPVQSPCTIKRHDFRFPSHSQLDLQTYDLSRKAIRSRHRTQHKPFVLSWFRLTLQTKNRLLNHTSLLTRRRAVIDSFIHRFSSRRCPSTMHAHRRNTKRQIETTCMWSEPSLRFVALSNREWATPTTSPVAIFPLADASDSKPLIRSRVLQVLPSTKISSRTMNWNSSENVHGFAQTSNAASSKPIIPLLGPFLT